MKERYVFALGMFDGVHLGHQALLREAVRLAAEQDAVPGAYSFLQHPMEVFGAQPRLLTGVEDRRTLLSQAGLGLVVLDDFTKELAACPPAEFIRWFTARYPVSGMVCGYNYTFGEKASGTPELLRSLSESMGFSLSIVEPVIVGGEPVSSTRIRRLLEDEGNVRQAASLLGRPYSLSGTVVGAMRNGRRIGFPTANIDPKDLQGLVLPRCGVYASGVCLNGKDYPSITNIGHNPTVSGNALSIETHIIGFTGDLYGTRLTVRLYEFLREERRFSSLEELKLQLERDREASCIISGSPAEA